MRFKENERRHSLPEVARELVLCPWIHDLPSGTELLKRVKIGIVVVRGILHLPYCIQRTISYSRELVVSKPAKALLDISVVVGQFFGIVVHKFLCFRDLRE